MLKKLARIYQARGISGLVRAIRVRLQVLLASRAKDFDPALFRGKTGLEIGGPSQVFTRRGIFPAYPLAARIDNCNFAANTVWEGPIEQGDSFHFDPPRAPGRQYLAEATDLGRFPAESYDFILSSHVLEHIANPLLALEEWARVLKPGGTLVLILPDPTKTFDHRRPVTTLEHLLADFEAKVGEDDLTHLPEILALHNLERDPEAGTAADFETRSRQNLQNRCLHHHVFDDSLILKLIDHGSLTPTASASAPPFHSVTVACKPIR